MKKKRKRKRITKKNENDISIKEDIPEDNELPQNNNNNPVFESGPIESNYIISVKDSERLLAFLVKTAEIYDDDFIYSQK